MNWPSVYDHARRVTNARLYCITSYGAATMQPVTHLTQDAQEIKVTDTDDTEAWDQQISLAQAALDAAVELDCFLRNEDHDLSVVHNLFRELKEETTFISSQALPSYSQRLMPTEVNALFETYANVTHGETTSVSKIIIGTKEMINHFEKGLEGKDADIIREIVKYCNCLYRNIQHWQSQVVDFGHDTDRLPM